MTEAELISLLIQKNEAAFKQLVETYQHKVYNTCLGLLQNSDDAEEITQDVFIEVFYSVNKFDGRSSLSTWIYRIAINKSLDKLRHNKLKKRFGTIVRIFQSEKETNTIADFIHPGVALEQKELSIILFKAIDQLPEKQKSAYILHHIESVSYREISEIMQTTVSSVESLLFRAKENLKKFWKIIIKKIINRPQVSKDHNVKTINHIET